VACAPGMDVGTFDGRSVLINDLYNKSCTLQILKLVVFVLLLLIMVYYYLRFYEPYGVRPSGVTPKLGTSL